jgi:ABC-type Fe3+-siderophore transport system permease subunit
MILLCYPFLGFFQKNITKKMANTKTGLGKILLGSDHRLVLPGSFLFGATLLNFADLISRIIVIPAEMPIGVITALIGAPFFIWLIFNLNKSKN